MKIAFIGMGTMGAAMAAMAVILLPQGPLSLPCEKQTSIA